MPKRDPVNSQQQAGREGHRQLQIQQERFGPSARITPRASSSFSGCLSVMPSNYSSGASV